MSLCLCEPSVDHIPIAPFQSLAPLTATAMCQALFQCRGYYVVSEEAAFFHFWILGRPRSNVSSCRILRLRKTQRQQGLSKSASNCFLGSCQGSITPSCTSFHHHRECYRRFCNHVHILKDLFISVLCVFSCMYVCASHVCLVLLEARSSRTRVTDNCEPLYGLWGRNLVFC